LAGGLEALEGAIVLRNFAINFFNMVFTF